MKKTLLAISLTAVYCHAQTGNITVTLTTPPGRILLDETPVIKVAVSNGLGR